MNSYYDQNSESSLYNNDNGQNGSGNFSPNNHDDEKKSKSSRGKMAITIVSSLVAGALISALCIPPIVKAQLADISAQAQPTTDINQTDKNASDPTPIPTATEQPQQQAQDESYLQNSYIGANSNLIQIAETASKSVVGINAYSAVSDRFNRMTEQSSAGSGVIISDKGYIVTNEHVISGADKIVIKLSDGSEYEAKLVGSDATTDLAVLSIEDASKATPIAVGDSNSLKVGETAIAIGNPLGTLGGSVTSGIVSALNRQINIDGKSLNLIQTDAAINPGNSGGALLNSRGQLVGINTVKTLVAGYDAYGNPITAEGLGFAIPINEAMSVIEQIIEKGKVDRPGIGVSAVVEIDLEKAKMWNVPVGLLVGNVSWAGSAEKAGLKADDIILKVDGASVTKFADLQQAIKAKNIGDKIQLEIWRSGETSTIDVVIGDINDMNKLAEEKQKELDAQRTQQQQQLLPDDIWNLFPW